MASEKRLVDARYLTSQMYLICEVCQTENIFIDAIIDEIDNAPDVDAVEVVHGRWIDNIDENGYLCNAWRKCSACGGLNYSKRPPYCPNCGAKMDGDGNG